MVHIPIGTTAQVFTECFRICVAQDPYVEAAVQGNKQNGHKPQHEAEHKVEHKAEQKVEQKAEHKAEHKAEAAAKKEEVHVGSSIGMSGRNPLDLIKTDAPLLSEAKTSKSKRALAPLLDAAGRDEACVWYRVIPHPLITHHCSCRVSLLHCPAINASTRMLHTADTLQWGYILAFKMPSLMYRMSPAAAVE